ncbi:MULTISPECIES: LLM class flavin-dependent oxidoreductase [unclassified Bradyrhizobium]|uniref:LLM class flavin-dependent oxidoreductase n=1 Tax=unclassified Bradyrhizobium TaxID=2631580 RepID=UPI002916FC46|nr:MULTISPECIES: LLM class flavin-dependent oxidoreductase [unclassified Bradyrhizobium]
MNTRHQDMPDGGPADTATARIFVVAPRTDDPGNFIRDSLRVAQFSDRHGFTGILLFTGNNVALDAWSMAHRILSSTRNLSPLIAVNPIYSHPFTTAKMISSIAQLFDRKVFLNMVTGATTSDLVGLGDHRSHAERYERLEEYIAVVSALCTNPRPLNYDGNYYKASQLKLHPPLLAEFAPEFLIAGGSDNARRLSASSGSIAMQMLPPDLDEGLVGVSGVNMGILTRESKDEAWAAARQRFPDTVEGKTVLSMTMANTDSIWKKRLYAAGGNQVLHENGYWLSPFMNYQADCPYLVGSYFDVASFIKKVIEKGIKTIILDVIPDEEELVHIQRAMVLSASLADH